MTTIDRTTNQIHRSNVTPVKDMHPMSKQLISEVIVLQKDGEPVTTRDGDMIYRFMVADRSASIILTVWGNRGQLIKSGDILRVAGANCTYRKGQDTFPFVDQPNMSEVQFNTNMQNNNRNTRPPRSDNNYNNNNNTTHNSNNSNNSNNNTNNSINNNNVNTMRRGGYNNLNKRIRPQQNDNSFNNTKKARHDNLV
ncbi:hypothetical protein BDB01DRAFT_247140 [Pilobolus umbonatus]|nr:hypothetical protein BDB01DRAFT_247140 [Pilobolus umbonatus]